MLLTEQYKHRVLFLKSKCLPVLCVSIAPPDSLQLEGIVIGWSLLISMYLKKSNQEYLCNILPIIFF